MQQPVSIAPLLWNHQTARQLDKTITHGKGRKGIIIRARKNGKSTAFRAYMKSIFGDAV
ncbi:hypothetical protein ACUNIW_22810 [Serratia sp. IR-2025]